MMKVFSLLLIFCTFLFATGIVKEQDCQYKDKFLDGCKHYTIKYTMLENDLLCVQECQHWDSFFQKCLYEKTCQIDEANKVFYQTECFVWDSFFKKCKEEKKILIKPRNLKDIQIILKRD